MSRRSQSAIMSRTKFALLLALVIGLSFGVAPRRVRAANENDVGLVRLEQKSPRGPELGEPGDDDQPTVSGRKNQRSTTDATPSTGGESRAVRSGGGSMGPAGRMPLFERVRLFARVWWILLR